MSPNEGSAKGPKFKEGDVAFIRESSYRGGFLMQAAITRVGKTHITAKCGDYEHKYRVGSLERIGRGSGRIFMGDPHYYLVEATQEIISEYSLQLKRIECRKIIDWLQKLNLREVKPETLEAYYEILIQFEKKGDS